MEKWECTVCGYIHDLENNIKTDTPFEALPEDWICPVCGASEDQFVKRWQRWSCPRVVGTRWRLIADLPSRRPRV